MNVKDEIMRVLSCGSVSWDCADTDNAIPQRILFKCSRTDWLVDLVPERTVAGNEHFFTVTLKYGWSSDMIETERDSLSGKEVPLVLLFSVAAVKDKLLLEKREIRTTLLPEHENVPSKIKSTYKTTDLIIAMIPIPSGNVTLIFKLVWGFLVSDVPQNRSDTQPKEGRIARYALSEEFSDVVFRVGQEKFPAHKVILAAKSDVFAALFTHSTKEQKTNCVVIEDTDPEVFRELLNYVYTGQVSLTVREEHGPSLLLAADKYNLPGLVSLCLPYAINSETNFTDIMKLYMVASSNHKISALKSKIVEWMKGKTKEFVKSDEFKLLLYENPGMIAEFLPQVV